MKHVKLTPFPIHFYIAFGHDEMNRFAARMHLHDPERAKQKADAVTAKNDHSLALAIGVWFNQGILDHPRERVMQRLPGVLAHEADHVVSYIYEMIGEEERTDEIRAYIMGWIVDLMWQEWNRRWTEHNKKAEGDAN